MHELKLPRLRRKGQSGSRTAPEGPRCAPRRQGNAHTRDRRSHVVPQGWTLAPHVPPGPMECLAVG